MRKLPTLCILSLPLLLGTAVWLMRSVHGNRHPSPATRTAVPSVVEPGLFLPTADPAGRAGAHSLRSRVAQFRRDLLEQSEPVLLNLFPDVSVRARLARVPDRSPECARWTGTLEEPHRGTVALVDREGTIAGVVRIVGKGVYEIRSGPGALVKVEEIDENSLPPCGGAPEEAGDEESRETRPFTLPDLAETLVPSQVIDVLVVYTREAISAAGGSESLLTLVDLAETETNMAYQRSRVRQRIRIVGRVEVDYEETHEAEDLERLRRPDDGYLDEVHAIRNDLGADLVCMIVSELWGFAGKGYILRAENGSFAHFEDHAFSMVEVDAAVANMSFAHELGHNMGCAHDRQSTDNPGAFPFSFGYRDPQVAPQWRTIMAYRPGIRVPYFSNPAVLFYGEPTGAPPGSPESADNALTMTLTAPSVASFRPTRVLVADAGPDQTVTDLAHDGNQGVTLDGTRSAGPIPISSYEWWQGETLLARGAIARVSLSSGEHAVTLVVSDGRTQDSDIVTIRIVPEQPPIADAGANQAVSDDDYDGFAPVVLDGSHSRDPDGWIVSYEWYEGDVLLSTGRRVTVPLGLGTHVLRLDVVDQSGLRGTDEAIVLVTRFLLEVPRGYPTIQAAIDDAMPGATVRVADGVYKGAGYRDIDFRGKAITVCSQNGPKSTIIDCEGSAEDPHRGFLFIRGETETSVLDGFTIRGGYGSTRTPRPDGGAIHLEDAWPTLRNLVFSNNYSEGNGGALSYVDSGPDLKRCTFESNRCDGNGGAIWGRGAGVGLYRSQFIGNAAGGNGGAIHVEDGSAGLLESSVIGNRADLDGGAISLVSRGRILTAECRVLGNSAGGRGGAVFLARSECYLVCTFFGGNWARNGGGGVLYQEDRSSGSIEKCVLAGNGAATGGALHARQSRVDVMNSTLAHNRAVGLGGAMVLESSSTELLGCILWGNTSEGGLLRPIHSSESFVKAGFSIVQGGWQGERILNRDPRFVDPESGNYHLLPRSPAIDAGWGGSGDFDLEKKPYFDAPRVSNTGGGYLPYADMGAYEWTPGESRPQGER